MSNLNPSIDDRLMTAIKDGNCVAFVGAGFSAAAGLPQWQELITELAKPGDLYSVSKERAMVNSLLGPDAKPSSKDFEMAAQLLFDALGEEEFYRRLSQQLKDKNPKDAMTLRLKHLRGIPFRAIVTTNFDPLIQGAAPSAGAYRKLLRPRRPPSPWREAVTRIALGQDPLHYTANYDDSIVVQLHGHLKSVLRNLSH